MTRILICNRHGGWGLSRTALKRLRELGSQHALDETDIGEHWGHDDTQEVRSKFYDTFLRDIPRDDPLLLQVWEELGQHAAGRFCHIAEVQVPDGVNWFVDEYDGAEWVAEQHRTWR